MAVRQVTYVVNMQDRMSRKMQRLSGTTSGLNMNFGRLAASMGLAFGGGMLVRNIFKTITGFEKSMSEVKALTRATADEFERLNTKAIELGSSTVFTGQQAASAMVMLSRAGFTVDQILTATKDTLNLAAAGNLDLARASDISSDVLTAFGMRASQLTNVVDIMARTATTSNTTIELMGDSMRYAAPLAKAAGVEIEELSALIGMLGSAGIKGSMAGTQLRMTLSRLISKTGQNKLRKFGVEVLDQNNKLKNMRAIIKEMQDKNLTPGDVMSIFGERAGSAMVILMQKGSEAVEKYFKVIKENEGEAERIAKEMTDNVSGDITRLTSAWGGMWQTMAKETTVFSNFLRSELAGMTLVLNTFQKLLTSQETLGKKGAAKIFEEKVVSVIEKLPEKKREKALNKYYRTVLDLDLKYSKELHDIQAKKIPSPVDVGRTKELRKQISETKELLRLIGGYGDEGIVKKPDPTKPLDPFSKETKEVLQTVSGVRPKVFNINIDSLIEDFSISTTTLKESTTSIKEQVLIALTQALNEAQTIAQ